MSNPDTKDAGDMGREDLARILAASSPEACPDDSLTLLIRSKMPSFSLEPEVRAGAFPLPLPLVELLVLNRLGRWVEVEGPSPEALLASLSKAGSSYSPSVESFVSECLLGIVLVKSVL